MTQSDTSETKQPEDILSSLARDLKSASYVDEELRDQLHYLADLYLWIRRRSKGECCKIETDNEKVRQLLAECIVDRDLRHALVGTSSSEVGGLMREFVAGLIQINALEDRRGTRLVEEPPPSDLCRLGDGTYSTLSRTGQEPTSIPIDPGLFDYEDDPFPTR